MNKNSNISLKDVGKDLPFSVPENYFENLTAQITAQTCGKHISLRKMAKPWLYLVAMFAGIVILGNIAYALYLRNTNLKIENYERYLFSQVDDATLIDLYFENLTENNE